MIEASLYNTPSGGYAADIGDDGHKSHGTPSHGCYQPIVERNLRHGVRTATASMAYNTRCYHLYLCSRSDELRTRNYATRHESTAVCYDLVHHIEESNDSALEVDTAVLALAASPSIVQPCIYCSMLAHTASTTNSVYYSALLVHIADFSHPINDGSTVPEDQTRSNQTHAHRTHPGNVRPPP